MILVLTLLFLVLLVPYIMHYYTLENEVQTMYTQYDEICLLYTSADVVWKDGSAVNKLFSSGLMAGGGIGVALFAMLTGYFPVSYTHLLFIV